MKLIDKIVEILVKNISYETHGKWTIPVLDGNSVDNIAEEINDLVYEKSFVEWLEFGNHQFYCNPEIGVAEDFYNAEDHTRYTLDELHEYWLTIKTE